MIDPISIFLGLFGGAILGLVAGLARKRGFIDTLTYIVVAGIFGPCFTLLIARTIPMLPLFFNGKVGSIALLFILYATPLVGGLVGVFTVGLARRIFLGMQPERPTTTRGQGFVKIGYTLLGLAVVLLIVMLLAAFAGSQSIPMTTTFLQWALMMLFFALLALSGYVARAIARRI